MDNKVTMEITNDKLEAAIKEYNLERTQEKLALVLNLMRPTKLLAPAMLKGEGQPEVCFLRNDKGDQFLAVFTSKEQIPAEPKAQAILSMPFPVCNAMVANDANNLLGMVINPFTDNLILSKDLVKRLHEADKKMGQPQQIKLTPEQFQIFVKKQVEFGVLPKRLFTEKEAFVNKLFEEKEAFINQIFAEVYKEPKLNPFTEADYGVMALNIAEDLKLVRIDFPNQGIVTPLCYRVYITFDPITKKAGYYTIEKMAEGNDRLLGGFGEDGKHISYGVAPIEGTEMDRVIDLARTVDEITS